MATSRILLLGYQNPQLTYITLLSSCCNLNHRVGSVPHTFAGSLHILYRFWAHILHRGKRDDNTRACLYHTRRPLLLKHPTGLPASPSSPVCSPFSPPEPLFFSPSPPAGTARYRRSAAAPAPLNALVAYLSISLQLPFSCRRHYSTAVPSVSFCATISV